MVRKKFKIKQYIGEDDNKIVPEIIRIIKKSKKGVLLIAPPDSGKTTFLRESGVALVLQPTINGILAQKESDKYYDKHTFGDTLPLPAFATYEKGVRLSEELIKNNITVIDEAHQITHATYRVNIGRAIENAKKVSEHFVMMSGTLDVPVFEGYYDTVIEITQHVSKQIDLHLVDAFYEDPNGNEKRVSQHAYALKAIERIHRKGKKALVLMQNTSLCKIVRDTHPSGSTVMVVGNESSHTQRSDPNAAPIIKRGIVPDKVKTLIGTTTYLEAWNLVDDQYEWEVVICTSANTRDLALPYIISQFASRVRSQNKVNVYLQIFSEDLERPIAYNAERIDKQHREKTKAQRSMGKYLPSVVKIKTFCPVGEPLMVSHLQHRQKAYDNSVRFNIDRPEPFTKECKRYNIHIVDISNFTVFAEQIDLFIPKTEAMINMIEADAVPTHDEVKHILGISEIDFFKNSEREAHLMKYLKPLFAGYKKVNSKAKTDLYQLAHLIYESSSVDEVLRYLNTLTKKGGYRYNGCESAYRSINETVTEGTYLDNLRGKIFKKFTERVVISEEVNVGDKPYQPEVTKLIATEFTSKELYRYLKNKVDPKHFGRFKEKDRFAKDTYDKEERLEKFSDGKLNVNKMMKGLMKYKERTADKVKLYELDVTDNGDFTYDTLVLPNAKYVQNGSRPSTTFL